MLIVHRACYSLFGVMSICGARKLPLARSVDQRRFLELPNRSPGLCVFFAWLHPPAWRQKLLRIYYRLVL